MTRKTVKLTVSSIVIMFLLASCAAKLDDQSLRQMVSQSGYHTQWRYTGSSDRFHYLERQQSMLSREKYRIEKRFLQIGDEIAVTSDSGRSIFMKRAPIDENQQNPWPFEYDVGFRCPSF